MSETNSANGVQASVSHITDDMVEAVERAWPSIWLDGDTDWRGKLRGLLEAALAGCTVVALPNREPDPPNGWRVPTWNYDVWQVQAFDDDVYPVTMTSNGKGYGMAEDLAEAVALRLLAAVQHHRQRRAESAGGSQVGDQHGD